MNKKNTLKRLEANVFYDINKFPAQPGITVVGISMPLITTRQSPAKCFESSKHLISKIKRSGVGAVISYSDWLYMYSNEPSSVLKIKFQKLVEEHKRGYLNLIEKDVNIIPAGFSFIVWNQLMLDCPDFLKYLEKLKSIYKKDKRFQQYVAEDIKASGKEVNENTISYILEEVLLDYLVVKGKVRLQNDFVKDHQKWILNCYHGKPHRTHAYVHQKGLLGLKSDNPYQDSWYDLTDKKLYEFDRMDIATFDFDLKETS